jgi:hypothetical protein
MQIKWHDEAELSLRSENVDISGWWKGMDSKLLEGVVFRSGTVEPIFAEDIAPWLPPACRGKVVNTEHKKRANKTASTGSPIGCPKTLAELIRNGSYNPLDAGSFSALQLQELCSLVKIPINGSTSKVAFNA